MSLLRLCHIDNAVAAIMTSVVTDTPLIRWRHAMPLPSAGCCALRAPVMPFRASCGFTIACLLPVCYMRHAFAFAAPLPAAPLRR